jgi:hypothetical protein
MAKQHLSEETSALRKLGHFQVRLNPELAQKLHHFMESRDYSANQALRLIISQFFNGKNNA